MMSETPATRSKPSYAGSAIAKWMCILSSILFILSLSLRLLLHYNIVSINFFDANKSQPHETINEPNWDFSIDSFSAFDSPSPTAQQPKDVGDDADSSEKVSSKESSSAQAPPQVSPSQAPNKFPSTPQPNDSSPDSLKVANARDEKTAQPTTSPTLPPTSSPTVPPSKAPTSSPMTTPPSSLPTPAPFDTEPEKVVFYVLGDIPYDDDEKDTLRDQMKDIPNSADFVMHIGDIMSPAKSNCKKSAYSDVQELLLKSAAPVFVTPGDNDINDCPDPATARSHWLNNFDRLEDNWDHNLPVARQESRSENFAFFYKGSLFIGVNLVGDANIYPNETVARHADNLEWTRQQLAKYGEHMVALVIFGHAKPRTARYHADYFIPVLREVEERGTPAIYIHGDFHYYKNTTFDDHTTIQRLQVDQGIDMPPVKITIRPLRRQRFDIDCEGCDDSASVPVPKPTPKPTFAPVVIDTKKEASDQELGDNGIVDDFEPEVNADVGKDDNQSDVYGKEEANQWKEDGKDDTWTEEKEKNEEKEKDEWNEQEKEEKEYDGWNEQEKEDKEYDDWYQQEKEEKDYKESWGKYDAISTEEKYSNEKEEKDYDKYTYAEESKADDKYNDKDSKDEKDYDKYKYAEESKGEQYTNKYDDKYSDKDSKDEKNYDKYKYEEKSKGEQYTNKYDDKYSNKDSKDEKDYEKYEYGNDKDKDKNKDKYGNKDWRALRPE